MVSNSLLDVFGVWTLTYLAHSTLLLGAAWLICRGFVQRSHVLRERLWKLAAIGGLVTATLAVIGGWGFSVVAGAGTDVTIADSTESRSSAIETTRLEPAVLSDVISAEDADLLREAEQVAALFDESAEPDSSDIALVELPIVTRRTGKLARRVRAPEEADVLVGDESASKLEQGFVFDSTQSAASTAESSPAEVEPVEDAQAAAVGGPPLEGRSGLPVLRSMFSPVLPVIGCGAVAWVVLGLLRVLQREWALHRVLRRCVSLGADTSSIGVRHEAPVALQLMTDLMSYKNSRWRRTPRLVVSQDVSEPMACGVWSPTIILPAGCEQRLSIDELRALLAHEFAHLQRGDVAWLWVGRVLCSSFAFQPLNFIARRAWQAAAEVQCDDWAVAHDVSAVSLASCLAQVAEWTLDRRAASALAATGSRGSLTVRIERLLADRTPDAWSTRWRSRLSLLAAFSFGLFFASIAPRLDESLWARDPVEEDLEERQQLWNEITSEISALQSDLERLPATEGEDGQARIQDLKQRLAQLGAR